MTSIQDLIISAFNGNRSRALAWMYVTNPALGGISPIAMINSGLEQELRIFIEKRLGKDYTA